MCGGYKNFYAAMIPTKQFQFKLYYVLLLSLLLGGYKNAFQSYSN